VTNQRVHRIDWREQLEALEPFLCAEGGVVHAVTSDSGAGSTFAKLVRARMASGASERRWISIQIDESNPSTHYFEDILVQIELSLEIPPVADTSAGPVVTIGSDVRAKQVEINDIAVTINEAGERAPGAGAIRQRVERIGNYINSDLANRVGLIFLNSHRHREADLRRFFSQMWDPHLQTLTAGGLLLVDIADPREQRCDVWPPDPTCVIDLPDRFMGPALAEARSDLAAIARQANIATTEGEGLVFAGALLAASTVVSEVHASLARALLQRPRTGDDIA
jgi:hypothetical protein